MDLIRMNLRSVGIIVVKEQEMGQRHREEGKPAKQGDTTRLTTFQAGSYRNIEIKYNAELATFLQDL